MPAPIAPDAVIDRPASQRLQEFRYRLGQSLVFGLPVLALQWFGRGLGGAESDRWVAVFQTILSGWVVYVAGAGMLAEGLLLVLTRQRLRAGIAIDATIAFLAVLLYVAGLPRVAGLLAGYPPARDWPAPFAACVVMLGIWTGARWVTQKSKLSRVDPGRA